MKENRLLVIVSASVLTISIVLTGRYVIHRYIVRHSNFRYTIGKVASHYFKGDVIGKTIEYEFRGAKYTNVCASHKCKTDLKVGEKYYMKVYTDDPDIFDILYSRKVYIDPPTIPIDGWTSLPPNKF